MHDSKKNYADFIPLFAVHLIYCDS